MNSIIKVTVDPISLVTTIEYEGINDKVTNDLQLVLSASAQNPIILFKKFIISWYDFKKVLISISRLFKSENVTLEFDEFSKKLLEEHLSDKRNLKSSQHVVEIEQNEFDVLLKKIGFDRGLKDEQKRDASKLLRLKHGANFSVPGAGKTTTILAVHTILKHLNLVSKLFVISPINAFISWEDEIKDIFKQAKPTILRLTPYYIANFSEVIKINPDVILVNYEKLRKDIVGILPFFSESEFHLILDESHRIKSGSNNLSYNQIIKLSALAKRRDILSGTPMPQSYLDLEPQFDFLWPAEKIITDLSNEKDDVKIASINTAIKSLYVRTTKVELGLKDPDIFYTTIKMGSIQGELYKLFKSEAARVLAGMDSSYKSNFRKIGKSVVRLLQASSNPMLLGINDEYLEENISVPENTQVWELLNEFIKYEKPPKIEYLKRKIKEITDENPNNKIVIWSYFVKNILLLEKIFKEYNPVSIYGGVPTGSDDDENSRESRIRKFHEDSTCKLMIANPQACGEGISLHKVCHYAIYLDRNFNAAHFLQSIDRIHRLGLDKSIDTKVEILISENSIDEVLIRRLNDKIITMGEILDDTYLKTLAYDPSDISSAEEDGIDYKDFEEIKSHILSK